MVYWIIIAVAFTAVSFCFSYWVRKKYHIPGKGYELFASTFLMLWAVFILGLYLSTCLKL